MHRSSRYFFGIIIFTLLLLLRGLICGLRLFRTYRRVGLKFRRPAGLFAAIFIVRTFAGFLAFTGFLAFIGFRVLLFDVGGDRRGCC